MAVDRLSITVQADLGQAVRDAAQASGTSVSSWVAEALAHAIRQRNKRAYIAEFEAEDGPFTEEERAWAAEFFAEAETLGRQAAAEKANDQLAS